MSSASVFPPFVCRAHDLVWSRKYTIFTLYFIVVGLIILFCLQTKPTYEVTATVSIKPAPLFNADVGKLAAERPEQFARPQISLLESEAVVRRAISVVGEDKLSNVDEKRGSGPGLSIFASVKEHIRSVIKFLNPNLAVELSSTDNAFLNVQRNLKIRAEPQTDIILIAFRSPDPQVAVEFTNALVQTFSHRYFEIYGNTGAVAFFSEQKLKSENALSLASTKLAEYSSKFSLYGLEEQRRLLLQQRSALTTALATTRGSVVDKMSQVTAMSRQMDQMKQPMAQSPQLRALGDQKGIDNQEAPLAKSVFNDPPMLLVKVYQDTVANLVRTNAEIAGLNALENEQKNSLKGVDQELAAMANREAQLNSLQVAVVQSKANVEAFSKKAFEEQLAQDLNERKFSPVQTLQEATRPLKPIWPKPSLLFAIGAALCFVPLLALLGLHYAIVSHDELEVKDDLPVRTGMSGQIVTLELDDFLETAASRALEGTPPRPNRKSRKAARHRT